jgi:hypothetical protein
VSESEITFLQDLAAREITRIRTLAQPVVRVCGPLTCDGPDGYARNAERLVRAETVLQGQGMTVWSFVDSEKEILGKGFGHDNIVTYFHKPVLESGLIDAAYFLPRSELSNGARRERTLCMEAGIKIREFPEAWLSEQNHQQQD